jgi:choline dehydrogenase-like flavoprotein
MATAALPVWMTEDRRHSLRLICDTVVPSIERAGDTDGFWARSASDLGVDVAIVDVLAGLPEASRAGLLGIVDALGELGISEAPPASREELLVAVARADPTASIAVGALIRMIVFLTYGLPDPTTGQNPMWRTLGYPGPVSPPPAATKTLRPFVPDAATVELDADVVVVGSGAGGGVIAGRLAQAGHDVVVLEAGGYFDESDFNQLELWAYQNLYWRGGATMTADFNVTLQAGATLGGGTTINWTNCLRTRPWVRTEWAIEHGLAGVDGPEFDRHLDEVAKRSSVTVECSDLNGPNQRLKDAADALGWAFEVMQRNTDPASYDPISAGYMGFGDQSGSKQGTMKTYLQDAFDAGARILVRTTAQRVLLEDGRAAGVLATYADPTTDATSTVTVRAPQVVVACGALESPALLLRSGIGGPAVGMHLRVHPVVAALGTYAEPQRAWWGPCMTAAIEQFQEHRGGYGFLIEAAHYSPASSAGFVPYLSGAAHKEVMAASAHTSWSIGLVRDHGSGHVTIDEDGQAVPWYSITDETDVANLTDAAESLVRAHRAAGAVQIRVIAEGLPTWRAGDDVEAFVATLRTIPFRAGGYRVISAHQMGTCRMGTDPTTSVAGPFGELHETRGVWIGDGSAFPTSSGTNPMLSIMALANRTAEAIDAAVRREGGMSA